MLSTSIPLRFTLAWGQNAGGAYIRTVPVTSQIGIQDGAASFNDGFVPLNATQIAAGGVPPFEQDMNGVMNITTTWDVWYQAGAPISYDATFSTAQGGYPKGAIVESSILAGAQWYSTTDSNATNPDDPLTSANWARVGIPAGMPMPFFTSTLPPGFVAMNALSIGNAASGAGYASADALFLYVSNWLNFSNAQCPVVGGRGANAVADFNAGKAMTLPNGKGLNFMGADTMGGTSSTFLSGVPVTSGNVTTPGSVIGESLHTLIIGEITAHQHSVFLKDPGHTHTSNATQVVSGTAFNGSGFTATNATISAAFTGMTIGSVNGVANDNQTAQTGGGGAHNNVERSMIVYWGQKL